MDTYIIRIYRRDAHCPQKIAGVVQQTIGDKTQPFATTLELWSILTGNIIAENDTQKGGSLMH